LARFFTSLFPFPWCLTGPVGVGFGLLASSWSSSRRLLFYFSSLYLSCCWFFALRFTFPPVVDHCSPFYLADFWTASGQTLTCPPPFHIITSLAAGLAPGFGAVAASLHTDEIRRYSLLFPFSSQLLSPEKRGSFPPVPPRAIASVPFYDSPPPCFGFGAAAHLAWSVRLSLFLPSALLPPFHFYPCRRGGA